MYSSRTMSLRTHQPFVSAEKAVNENIDIVSQKNILETENHRILVEETDEGEILRERVHDLKKQYYAANMDIARKNEALFVILEALRPTHYLAVITTGSRQNATEMLNHFHCTDWFDLILTQEDVVNNQPDPEGYLKAMAHFGVDAAHTMIFEDSATGLAAARATGASVFACNQF